MPGIIPSKPSSAAVTPNAWNDFPLFATRNSMRSPTLALMSGLCPSSPGSALNARVLKSGDSTKFR
ncbi:hypothetical protein QVH35_02080 [Candidatus Nitrosotenuis chungbukensis]|uniref:hypothetical protein n=1 Tax=Candidatus Nitrosotenuis chungbukensis TaxID=1353246 RepID=UPI002672B2A2|nr:hypothetical protein [Candidatus Nitrosotenuis chungbukensis]WKT58274.1 hypothetical protein QVH35_02080 [Candidatus Nitrosotenuis chungbukensis]